MKTNECMVDWLTITSYSVDDYLEWLSLLATGYCNYTKIMQYEGDSDGKVFVGEAIQRGKRHNMLRVSGERADEVARSWDEWHPGPTSMAKCTRLDAQVTTEKPDGWSWDRLYTTLTAVGPVGRERTITRIDSPSGHTVYVGSRQSEYMYRIYEKRSDEGEPFVRFEVECKGKYASQVEWMRYKDGHGLDMLLLREALSLPACFETDTILAVIPKDGIMQPRPRRVIPEADGRLDWLRKQVTPALHKMLNDHDVSGTTGRIIEGWYRGMMLDKERN